MRADDEACVKFYKDSEKTTEAPTHTIYSRSRYTFSLGDTSRSWTVDLKKGEVIFISAELVNWGGPGNLHIGLCMPDQEYKADNEIKDIPVENIIGPDVTNAELEIADQFKGWQPQFVDSIKNATIDYQTSTSGWQVLQEPASEGGSGGKNLVDGNEGTIFHSKYNGGKAEPPHVFVIDTLKDQTFNYFEFVRRTNGNDKLLNFKLYGCTSSAYETAAQTGESGEGWQELFDGASSNVNAARQRISFARRELRYFKFVVTNNSGHTVLREIYAGTESKLSQTVKPSNYKTKMENFEENSANGKLTATASGAVFEFKFLGNGFELYADTDPSFGKASVTVDGIFRGNIDLNDKPLFNKQVFLSGELEMQEHVVVVTTLDENPFNISFINVQYGTPVAAAEYPADKDENGQDDYGDQEVPRQFTREWKTFVKDYKELTSIQFLKKAPQGYKDTYVRIDTYIRLYRNDKKIAFVYPGTILAPIECGSLFSGCEKLTEIVFENFDTTYMRGTTSMFYGCSSLETLDVSAFETKNVLGYGKMFAGCTNLSALDLGKFQLDENANLNRMFENCTELATIELPKEIGAQAVRGRAAGTKITCELPYVYRDETTGQFYTELVLDASIAGHKLTLHNVHEFAQSNIHKQQNPTCVEAGTIAYQTCSICKCDFDVEQGKTLYRAGDLVIPATGHDFGYEEPPIEGYPTCTNPGIVCRHYCKTCNMDCPDDNGMVAMPALGHSYMLDTEKGEGRGYTVEYRREEVVEKTEMVDENGEVYFTQEEIVVKGIARVTFYLKCQGIADWLTWDLCGHTAEVVFEFDCDTHTDATCTDAETFFYDFSIEEGMLVQAMVEQDEEDDVEDGLYASGFRTVVINTVVEGEEAEGGFNALGHDFEKVEAVAATCESSGSTEGQKCSVCGLVKNVTDTKPLGHNMEMQPRVEPTCTEAGHEAGRVCTRCGHEEDENLHLEPLGHDFSVEIEEELPTCTKVGHTSGKKCSRCDAMEGHDLVDDLGHVEEVIPGKDPTKTESGLTDGLVCSRCGEILKEQEEIPALGGSSLGTVAWVMIGLSVAAVAAAVVVTVVLVTKKKRNKS